jgi:hypothetical protein
VVISITARASAENVRNPVTGLTVRQVHREYAV